MKILKTLMPLEGEGLILCDTIEYEGELWLVPEWIYDTPSKGLSNPARIICMTFLRKTGPFPKTDYTLSDPIPKSVFEGHISEELKSFYRVIQNPKIIVESPVVWTDN